MKIFAVYYEFEFTLYQFKCALISVYTWVLGLIFHENHLLADDSHDKSSLISQENQEKYINLICCQLQS